MIHLSFFMKSLMKSSLMICMGLTLLLVLPNAVPRALAADANPIVGDWEGTLDPGAQPKKRVVVHISAAQDGTLSGTIDYPDDNSSGAVITAITFKQSVLHLESEASLVAYDGTMNKDTTQISGAWKQGGKSLDLTLKRTP
jgi:hypothetical protein